MQRMPIKAILLEGDDAAFPAGFTHLSLRESKRLAQSIAAKIESAVDIRIDNVTEYVLKDEGKPTHWSMTDFPNIAPPFPVLWMETVSPTSFGGSHLRGWGVLIESDVREEDDGGWDCAASMFLQYDSGQVFGPMAEMRYGVSPSGTIDSMNARQWMEKEVGSNYDEVAEAFHYYFVPVYLSLSFMHCANVELSENLPTRQQRREAQRKNEPVDRFYTLNIGPMKQTLATEGDSERVGIKKALHICRGHFSHYGEDYGKGKLFGKYEGQFWVPSHVRGHVEEGTVHKNYAVKAG